jgi:flagellar basal-body rod protein FlgB
MSGLIDRTTIILSQALDGLTARQSAISANLANIDTPGYKPQAVSFENALQREIADWNGGPGNAFGPSSSPSADVAMKTTDSRHFSSLGSLGDGSMASVSTTNENTRNDDNRVDLETEMTALTQTQIMYSATSRMLTKKVTGLNTVLGGR